MGTETTVLDELQVEIPLEGYDVGYGTPDKSYSQLLKEAFQAADQEFAELNDVPRITAGDSVQDTLDALPANGGRIAIAPDWDPTVETYPILVEKPVTIAGPGVTHDAEEFDMTGVTNGSPIFRVDTSNNSQMTVGTGQSTLIRDLTFVGGGGVAVHARDTPYVKLLRIRKRLGGGGLVRFSAPNKFTFNSRIAFCESHDTADPGVHFEPGANAHATTVFGSRIHDSASKGILNDGGGTNIGVIGGTVQHNENTGIDLRDQSNHVYGTYIEKNGTAQTTGVGVYLGGTGSSINSCRFQGTDETEIGVRLAGTGNEVLHNGYRQLTSGFVDVVSGATDGDIHATTNTALDGATTFLVGDAGTRTRSNGVIGGAGLGGVTLSATTGQFVGDGALTASATPAWWDGSAWRSVGSRGLQLTTTDTTTGINGSTATAIPWDTQLDTVAGVSHSTGANPEQITFDRAGRYEIEASVSAHTDGSAGQVGPAAYLSVNGTELDGARGYSYLRGIDGLVNDTLTADRVVDVASGDTLTVEGVAAAANTGAVTLNANESLLRVSPL